MSQPRWSPYQQAIFANFEDDAGNTVVQARAGSGKTTTIIEGVDFVPRGRRVILTAFNKSIERELKRRAPRRADVRTLHGAGFAAVRRAFGDVEVDENKAKEVAAGFLIDAGRSFVTRGGVERAIGAGKVAKLVGLAKNTLTEDEDELLDLAIDYDLDDDPKLPVDQLVEFAKKTLEATAEMKSVIDFDDMVWFPARHELRPASHDVVLVDETQDLNAAQLYLVQALCKKGGRIVAVGDEAQAIYGFRGADSEAMPRLIRELEATVLPLSITYRCPKQVVALAQKIVPDLEAAPGAKDGNVRTIAPEAIADWSEPGDLVLSRANAPLRSLCLRVLKRGIPACIAGRDIGKSLIALIERAEAGRVVDVLHYVDDWRRKEVEKYEELEKEKKVAAVIDRAAAIHALCDGESHVTDVIRKIERLFRDDDPETRVVFSSVHKAKGLERERVFLVADTFSPDSYKEEERNLYYVAVTRSKDQLFFGGKVRENGGGRFGS
jgi:DNA helicase-2/ATP-dependent DNA helicase PcrA